MRRYFVPALIGLALASAAAWGVSLPLRLGLGLTGQAGVDNAPPVSPGTQSPMVLPQLIPLLCGAGGNPLCNSTSVTVTAPMMQHLWAVQGASRITFSLPQAGTAGFEKGQQACAQGDGSGGFTIHPLGSSVLKGVVLSSGNLVLGQYASTCFTSNGADWEATAPPVAPPPANCTSGVLQDGGWDCLLVTTAPNDTVNASVLTADKGTAATTGEDAVVIPNLGSTGGAFTLTLADGTTAGGNKRGQGAVDLQIFNAAIPATAPTNVASGGWATIAGGYSNTASSGFDAVLGGENNTASGGSSGIVSGFNNAAPGTSSFTGAGNSNTTSGSAAGVVAGNSNTASGNNSFTGAGDTNTASGPNDVIGGGHLNQSQDTTTGDNVITGGSQNSIGTGSGNNVIGGGNSNAIPTGQIGGYNTIGGGWQNTVTGAEQCTIGGGLQNICTGEYGTVAGGWLNSAADEAFAAGYSNTASATGSVAIGTDNTASGYAVGSGNNVSAGGSALGFDHVLTGQSVALGGFVIDRGINGYLGFGEQNLYNGGGKGLNQLGTIILCLYDGPSPSTDATLTSQCQIPSPSATNQLVLGDNETIGFRGWVVARAQGPSGPDVGLSSYWNFACLIKRGSSAATTALVGTCTPSLIAQDAGMATLTVTVQADTTNGAIRVVVNTGVTTLNVNWTGRIETEEIGQHS
jgi:hypothetical protein